MSVFAIFRASKPDAIREALAKAYADEHLELQNDEWLVSASQTAEEVSDALGISEGESGSAIVVKVGSYFGRAPSSIWEWIKVKSEARD